jgi:hypothetical protein
VGFVGTWGPRNPGEGVKLGSKPRKADENQSLSHRIKSNKSTLAAKRTVKSPLSFYPLNSVVRIDSNESSRDAKGTVKSLVIHSATFIYNSPES